MAAVLKGKDDRYLAGGGGGGGGGGGEGGEVVSDGDRVL